MGNSCYGIPSELKISIFLTNEKKKGYSEVIELIKMYLNNE